MSEYSISVGGRSYQVSFKSRQGSTLIFAVDGTEYRVEVVPNNEAVYQRAPGIQPKKTAQKEMNELRSPMPGIVSSVAVSPGDRVNPGDIIIVIEAMKMENPIRATAEAVVEEVLVKKGDEVRGGGVLVKFGG